MGVVIPGNGTPEITADDEAPGRRVRWQSATAQQERGITTGRPAVPEKLRIGTYGCDLKKSGLACWRVRGPVAARGGLRARPTHACCRCRHQRPRKLCRDLGTDREGDDAVFKETVTLATRTIYLVSPGGYVD